MTGREDAVVRSARSSDIACPTPHARPPRSISSRRRSTRRGTFAGVAFLVVALFAQPVRAQPNGFDPYPDCSVVIDVTRPPYGARGDGRTDDTDALQRALNDHVGRHHVIYLPAGTYRVSRTLTWPKRHGGRENWGKTIVRGRGAALTTLRLQDATFTNPAQPQAIMSCGGFGSADWFHNYVEDLTFDVGQGNPGATGLRFYSNNSGAVRNCRFVAPAGSGAVGLDLAHQDMNGPLLVRNCEVNGFRTGVLTGHAVNSQTFENLRLHGQTEVGFENQGQPISLRRLISANTVPALKTYGVVSLIEADLRGNGPAGRWPAIINYNGGQVFLRDVSTTGYRRALADMITPDAAAALRIEGVDRPGSLGPRIDEYSSKPATSPFGTGGKTPRLPIREVPEIPHDPPASWANVDTFGADPTGQADSAPAIQRAIDSGATTVFLPGHYRLLSTVVIRGKVRRVVGVGGQINYGKPLDRDLRLADGAAPVVMIEHLSHVQNGLEIDTGRTLVLRSVSDCDLKLTPRADRAALFLEDCVTHDLALRGQSVWARQLDIENEGTHLRNDGGTLWILGYKTERGGTLLETRGGGRSEILGGFSYTTTAGKLAPMFVTEGDNAAVFAFFSEVCFNGDPFATLIRETRRGQTRAIRRGEGTTLPYVAVPVARESANPAQGPARRP